MNMVTMPEEKQHNMFREIHLEEGFIVVEKEENVPIHKNDHMRRDHPYLTKAIGVAYGKQVYPVHRLDAKTSGLVILAFDRDTAGKLSQQFHDRDTEKWYLAMVKGNPGSGILEHELWDRKRKTKLHAKLEYTTLATGSTTFSYPGDSPTDLSLVRIRLHTGRWHQIRLQFGFIRHDVLGDVQHGDWTLNKKISEVTGAQRLLLHASELHLQHPETGESMAFFSEIPLAFKEHWIALTGRDLELDSQDENPG